MKLLARVRAVLSPLGHPSARAIGTLAGTLVFSVVLLGVGPWSPLALDRANRLLARGDVPAAIASCQRIARFNLVPRVRAEARYRAAILQATLANEPQQAVESLWSLLFELPLDSPDRPEALALLAATLETQLKRPARAARLYEEAAIAGEGDPRQSEWTLAAAGAYEAAGDLENAAILRARIAVSGDPRAAEAWLALGRSHLSAGDPAGAFAAYQHAMSRTADPSVRRLARLGLGLSLERLGKLDAAVAEFEEGAADEPGDEVAGRSIVEP